MKIKREFHNYVQKIARRSKNNFKYNFEAIEPFDLFTTRIGKIIERPDK